MMSSLKQLPRSISAPVLRRNVPANRGFVSNFVGKCRALKQAAKGVLGGERRRRSADSGRAAAGVGAGGSSPSPTTRLSPNEWTFAFDHVITDSDGRAQFTKFLQSEYSEENILFWWAVEELKGVASGDRQEFEKTVQDMFETFIAADSPLAINIDHDTRTDIIDRVQSHTPDTFPHNIYERAQAHVYRLMEKDCFSRFVHTTSYKELAKRLSLPQTFRFNGRLSPC